MSSSTTSRAPREPAAGGTGAGDPRTVLGRQVAARMRRPGPRSGQRGATLVGALAASSTRFADAMQQTATVRRALAGSSTVGAPHVAQGSAPPRWWSPQWQALVGHADESPARRPGEPRAAEPSRRAPGRTPTTAPPTTLPVRLPAEVAAAGPMVVAQDTRRRRPAPPIQSSGPPRGGEGSAPGQPAGPGHGQPAARAAAGPRSPVASPAPRQAAPRDAGVVRRSARPARGSTRLAQSNAPEPRASTPMGVPRASGVVAPGVPAGAGVLRRGALVARRAQVRAALGDAPRRTADGPRHSTDGTATTTAPARAATNIAAPGLALDPSAAIRAHGEPASRGLAGAASAAVGAAGPTLLTGPALAAAPRAGAGDGPARPSDPARPVVAHQPSGTAGRALLLRTAPGGREARRMLAPAPAAVHVRRLWSPSTRAFTELRPAVPGAVVPGHALPGTALPRTAVPGTAVTGTAVPGLGATVPDASGAAKRPAASAVEQRRSGQVARARASTPPILSGARHAPSATVDARRGDVIARAVLPSTGQSAIGPSGPPGRRLDGPDAVRPANGALAPSRLLRAAGPLGVGHASASPAGTPADMPAPAHRRPHRLARALSPATAPATTRSRRPASTARSGAATPALLRRRLDTAGPLSAGVRGVTRSTPGDGARAALPGPRAARDGMSASALSPVVLRRSVAGGLPAVGGRTGAVVVRPSDVAPSVGVRPVGRADASAGVRASSEAGWPSTLAPPGSASGGSSWGAVPEVRRSPLLGGLAASSAMAPPRGASLPPRPPAAAAAPGARPPVPAVARPATGGPSGVGATVRRSLDPAAMAWLMDAPTSTPERQAPMPHALADAPPLPRPAAPALAPATSLDEATLARIVDTVVERVEARLVDEVERRGHRSAWGVF
ncbi:hypothetical protein [Cellulomonas chengniuliangii]|uniref:hypothetical protein n=1 Tax=Cellulomonas chengniuliangii TaxID=2968084 RepID=UPI001D0DCCBB|nr:hypothetical protein [Cellulomonas chengniuliangii]MCC2317634.1 hypothetical protein [Cellulomonas chengniuliangii]